MKHKSLLGFLALGLVGASLVWAADPAPVTLVGKGECAKCALGKSDTCQNVVVVTKDGKEQIYYLTQNPLSEKFHDNVCTEPQEIKVVGVVKDNGDKKEITATSLELVKK